MNFSRAQVCILDILQTADVYRKLRFTLRYLLGNIADFDPARDAVRAPLTLLVEHSGAQGRL